MPSHCWCPWCDVRMARTTDDAGSGPNVGMGGAGRFIWEWALPDSGGACSEPARPAPAGRSNGEHCCGRRDNTEKH